MVRPIFRHYQNWPLLHWLLVMFGLTVATFSRTVVLECCLVGFGASSLLRRALLQHWVQTWNVPSNHSPSEALF